MQAGRRTRSQTKVVLAEYEAQRRRLYESQSAEETSQRLQEEVMQPYSHRYTSPAVTRRRTAGLRKKIENDYTATNSPYSQSSASKSRVCVGASLGLDIHTHDESSFRDTSSTSVSIQSSETNSETSPTKFTYRNRKRPQSSLDNHNVCVPTPDKKVRIVLNPPVRKIAHSSYSNSTKSRRRMISFSPERSSSHILKSEVMRRKLEKNLKATDKLEQRLEGQSALGYPLKTPFSPDSAKMQMINTHNNKQPENTSLPICLRNESSSGIFNKENSIEINGECLEIEEQINGDRVTTLTECTQSPGSISAPQSKSSIQLNPSMPLKDVVDMNSNSLLFTPVKTNFPGKTGIFPSPKVLVAEASLNTNSNIISENNSPLSSGCGRQAKSADIDYAIADCKSPGHSNIITPSAIGKRLWPNGATNFSPQTQPSYLDNIDQPTFTSTSIIEDVGLFNCETDVEYTGGVFGEGTDGKVTAAVIRGQKVALKRAKPHEGFSELEAKQRSAVELHYLRKVRHRTGFLQCLGLCDGIDHTCIALEVMDCKLSDYLRRYGQKHIVCNSVRPIETSTATGQVDSPTGANSHSNCRTKQRHKYTLSHEVTKLIVRKICQSMTQLHDEINIAHGDLACRNVLMRLPPTGYEGKLDPEVKLCDFGRIHLPSNEMGPNESELRSDPHAFSFYKNCDIGSFAREILFRLLVGEVVPQSCMKTKTWHKSKLMVFKDVVVSDLPEHFRDALGPFYSLFMRCTDWGKRPAFRDILSHLDDLEYFSTYENDFFPLKPNLPLSSEPSLRRAKSYNESSQVTKDKPSVPGATLTGSLQPGYSIVKTRTDEMDNAVKAIPSESEKSGKDPKAPQKSVNWLKARSVLCNSAKKAHNQQITNASKLPSGSAGLYSPLVSKNHVGNNRQPTSSTNSNVTPKTTTMLRKKTPPSSGTAKSDSINLSSRASKRSLHILNRIQQKKNL